MQTIDCNVGLHVDMATSGVPWLGYLGTCVSER
ncbi:hypothetical protein CGRA01v4_13639 [Colletotrichum graminicola]|nr:hypothetical protein CGRA01v4_13639 [Colletotrichum graminicola]